MHYSFVAIILLLMAIFRVPIEANHELIDIRSINSRIQFDKENLDKCRFAVRDVAERLSRVQKDLEKHCIGLYIYRAYYPRPFNKCLEDHHEFDNEEYDHFGHQRGTAVDVKLVYLNGCSLEMPSAYGEKVRGQLSSLQAHVYHNNYRLAEVMQRHGFVRIKEDDWWHFDYKFWRNYPVLNIAIECGCGQCKLVENELKNEI